ncbi:MAG: hypothetical protein WKG00_29695 [Polyangiaceae bacterium]
MRPRSVADSRRGRALPLCAAVAAVLCLWSQLAAIAHMALVAHVECAEHAGELVHVDGDGHPHGVAPAPTEDAALRGTGATASGHDQEHCGVAAHRSDQSVHAPSLAGVSLDVQPPSFAEAMPCAKPSAPAAPRPLLALAPKTSPPLV